MLPRAGDIVASRFVVEQLAGQGGMGSVFRARDLTTQAKVALKVLPGPASEADVERFAREARVLASLIHPGIVRYIEHGHTPEGMPFLAMEWLEGEDLWQRLHRQHLNLGESLLLLRQVAEALCCAHRRGIVHRDIKPSNLFLRDGQISRVTVLDFGVARTDRLTAGLTHTGVLVGTPGYMAPEQARGRSALRPSADIFALGCVLFECLTGRPPFTGEHLEAILVKILFEAAPPLRSLRPDLPEPLEHLLEKMLKKDPAQRLPDAMALTELLRTLDLTDGGVAGSTPIIDNSTPDALTSFEQQLFTVLIAREDNPQSMERTLGPQHVEELSQRLAPLRDELSALGLRTEVLADGALVGAFIVDADTAAIDQAERAVRCALRVSASWPESVVAVATGRGVLDGRRPMGEATGLAVRMVSEHLQKCETDAEAKEVRVVVDRATAGLTEARFRLSPLAEDIIAVLGERVSADETRPLLGKPTLCVGREPDLSMLEATLAACIEEMAPRALLVVAPPGAGKSRLRHEFLRRVTARDEDILILTGRGDLLGGGTPFGILREALLRLCGVLPTDNSGVRREKLLRRFSEVVPADSHRVIAFLGELCGVTFSDEHDAQLKQAQKQPRLMEEGVRRAFLAWLRGECAVHPLILILEDLQWGDAATVNLIDVALREIEDRALFILALARPEVADIFPRLWHERVQPMQLRPLSRKASEQLVRQILGKQVPAEAVTRIVEQAAGNALFLEELIRAAAEGKSDEMPPTVLAMLQSRIGWLEPGARRALRAASVFGDTCWSGGVAALLGTDRRESDRWLEVLEQSEILERRPDSRFPEETEYRFRHALLREAAYSLLADADRALGHRLAAGYLEDVDEIAAVLGFHCEEAGEYGKALYYYVGASDDAARLDQITDQRRHYEAALRMLQKLPDDPAFRRVHIDLLQKLVESGLTNEPMDIQLSRLGKAGTIIESLVPSTGRPSPDVRLSLAQLDLHFGRVLHYSGRPAEAIRHFQKALPIAEELGDADLALIARFNIGVSLSSQGAFRESCSLIEDVLLPMEARGELGEWSRCLVYHAVSLAGVGRYHEALAQIDRGLECITPTGQPSIWVRFGLAQASAHVLAADWPQALLAAQSALLLGRQYPERLFHYLSLDHLAWAESNLGQHDQAFDHQQRAREIRDAVGGGFGHDWFLAAESEMLLNGGRPEEALKLAQKVAACAKESAGYFAHSLSLRVAACALSRLGGSLEAVAALFSESLAVSSAHDQVAAGALTEVFFGRMLSERGERSAATAHFERGIAILTAAGCEYAASEARAYAEKRKS